MWCRLDDIGDIITGGTPSKTNPDYYGDDYPFVKPADLDAGRNTRASKEYLSQLGMDVSRFVKKGATAVCCIGTIGKSGYLTTDCATNQQINSIIPYINSLYLYYYCNSLFFINELRKDSSAVTISIVNKSKMEKITIPIPPIYEQERIVNQIEIIYKTLNSIEDILQ